MIIICREITRPPHQQTAPSMTWVTTPGRRHNMPSMPSMSIMLNMLNMLNMTVTKSSLLSPRGRA